jgi:hypothetical protein
MDWKEFDPANGKLRAEGTGQLITSRLVNSVGICLEYTRTEPWLNFDYQGRPTGSRGDVLLNSYLPVVCVSNLIFGLVPGNKNLQCYSRSMGGITDITGFLDFLDETGAENLRLTEHLQQAMRDKIGWIPGFNDIIPLTAPNISSRMSQLCNLPMPNIYDPGLLRTHEGLYVFCHRLRAYSDGKKRISFSQLHRVLEWVVRLESYDQWKTKEHAWACIPLNKWISPDEAYKASKEYQNTVHELLDKAEEYLVSINVDSSGSVRGDRSDQTRGFCYDTLLVEHIRMAVLAYDKIQQEWPPHWILYPSGRNWLSASMNMYWDELPALSTKVSKYTGCGPNHIVEAWITMIFRAFCWHHIHRLRRTTMVLPAEWHGSRMPVYVG